MQYLHYLVVEHIAPLKKTNSMAEIGIELKTRISACGSVGSYEHKPISEREGLSCLSLNNVLKVEYFLRSLKEIDETDEWAALV